MAEKYWWEGKPLTPENWQLIAEELSARVKEARGRLEDAKAPLNLERILRLAEALGIADAGKMTLAELLPLIEGQAELRRWENRLRMERSPESATATVHGNPRLGGISVSANQMHAILKTFGVSAPEAKHISKILKENLQPLNPQAKRGAVKLYQYASACNLFIESGHILATDVPTEPPPHPRIQRPKRRRVSK